jgi:O-antigen/teichoic acid export membrane protein
MSAAQSSIAEPAVVASKGRPRPARAVSGAGLLSAAMVLSGVLTYAFLVLAARTLGPSAYGRVGVLWGAMFIVAIVLFRPLEQTASRSIADRRARGEEVRSVATSVAALGGGLFLAVAVVAAVAWQPLSERLFGGDNALTALLVAGIGFYGLSYLVRGLVGGALWFNGYGINLIADGLGRLVLALPLLVAASRVSAGVAVAGAGLIAAVVPVALGRKRLRPLFDRSLGVGEGEPFERRRALRFAAPAGTIAASDQLLINGAPLLVMASGGAGATKAAGLAFAATMLVRAPVYVFQGVAAAILPNLTQVNATDGLAHLKREVARTAKLLFGVAVVVVLACVAGGPLGMRILYGHEYSASRGVFLALGIGVALYLIAATLSQALLAIDAGARAAVAWAAGAAALVLAYLILPGDELTRVGVSFAAGSLVLLLGLAALVFGRSRTS